MKTTVKYQYRPTWVDRDLTGIDRVREYREESDIKGYDGT